MPHYYGDLIITMGNTNIRNHSHMSIKLLMSDLLPMRYSLREVAHLAIYAHL